MTTKLYRPLPPAGAIARPHLVDRLNQGLNGRLTLLSAPAGFGKTCLLSNWLQQTNLSCGWISLDESDSDLGRFLAYWIAGLQAAGLAVDSQLACLLQSSTEHALEGILIPLINQVAAAAEQFVLVLDDYHLIQSDIVHEMISYWLEHAPRNLHLVIASRADPPLRLALLRGRGQINELRAAQLRFSSVEVQAFLKQRSGLDLAGTELQQLVERTDGWPAGLQMVAIVLDEHTEPSAYIGALSGSQSYIADFFDSEVYQRQPADIQEFLLKTSLLERFNADLCAAVTGQSGAAEMLAYLQQRNLFIHPLDSEQHWFRYHGLFADLNRQHLLQTQPQVAPQLYNLASQWFANKDLPQEAIQYALQAENWPCAARLIEQQAENTLMRSEIQTLVRWVEMLPQAIACQHENLCLYYAWALMASGQSADQALPYLEQVTPADEPTRGQLETLQAMAHFFQRQIPEAIEFSYQALAHLAQSDRFFRQIATWNLSALLFITGEQARGAELLAEVARLSQASQNTLVAVSSLCRLGIYHLTTGDLQRAQEIFTQARTAALDPQGQPLPIACEALFGLGRVAWEQDRLDQALEDLRQGLALSAQWRPISGIDAQISLANIYQSQAQVQQANASMAAARELAVQSGGSHNAEHFVASEEARLQLRQGDIQAVAAWARRRDLGTILPEHDLSAVPQASAGIILRYELLVYARYLLAAGQPRQALALLTRLIPSLQPLNHRTRTIEAYLLQALAQQAGGDLQAAVRSLQAAVQLAEPSGYRRVFRELGPQLEILVQTAQQHGPHSDFLAALLPDTARPKRQPTTMLVETLSPRENEVLRWLESDLSVPELAGRLHISPSTLRTHIRNIYSKLGVHSRFEATTRAREFNLL
ncbi:MAG: hypothetical protein JW862_19745 [Anaerolineales bacterium]|nr:hypothetical protein [Anaerolineales bacterium]